MTMKTLLRKLQKHGLKEVATRMEMHLYEPEMVDLARIDNDVRVVEVTGKSEFGIESDFEKPGKAVITVGGVIIEVNREDLMIAYHDWLMRDDIEKRLPKEDERI
jgi:hypothetical protein